MNAIVTVIIFSLCFAAMAIGLIVSKKALRKGCSIDPDSCACRKEGKDPSECENDTTTQP